MRHKRKEIRSYTFSVFLSGICVWPFCWRRMGWLTWKRWSGIAFEWRSSLNWISSSFFSNEYNIIIVDQQIRLWSVDSGGSTCACSSISIRRRRSSKGSISGSRTTDTARGLLRWRTYTELGAIPLGKRYQTIMIWQSAQNTRYCRRIQLMVTDTSGTREDIFACLIPLFMALELDYCWWWCWCRGGGWHHQGRHHQIGWFHFKVRAIEPSNKFFISEKKNNWIIIE